MHVSYVDHLRKKFHRRVYAVCSEAGNIRDPRWEAEKEKGREARWIPRIFHAHSVAGAVAVLLIHLFAGIAAAVASYAAFRRFGPAAGWGCYAAAAFLIGTRFRAIGNMLHEACHGTLVGGHRANMLFGYVLSAIELSCFSLYRHEHFTHHRHLCDAHKDHDFRSRFRFGFGGEGGPVSWRHVFLPLTLYHLPSYLRPVVWAKSDPLAVNLGKIFFLLSLAAVAHFLSAWKLLALYYWIPYAAAYPILKYWSDAFDHAGIMTSSDEFDRSRNHVFAWKALNRLLFPRNDEYHLVHHLFPSVPTTLQKRVHDVLMEDHEYRLRDHAAVRMFRRPEARRHAHPA